MTHAKLTTSACRAHKGTMKVRYDMARHAVMLAAGAVMLGGCVTVNAPSEPIVIELNINIKQEVVYLLAEDAGQTIDQNADIF